MDIITVRMHGEADNSPLEMISGKRLAHLKRVEAAAKAFLAALSSPDEARNPQDSANGSRSERNDLPKNGIHLPKK